MQFLSFRLAGVLLVTSVAVAQCCPGDMHGRVTDSAGAPVSNATVYVHGCNGSHENGAHDRPAAMTDKDGKYVVPTMAWGPCTVTVSAKGFQPYEKSDVRAVIDNNLEFNAVLQPGGVVCDGERLGGSPDCITKSQPWEYGVLVQGGNGLTEDRNGFHFMSAGLHVGKVLTPESGHGMLKGNFEYAVEVYPFWQSYTPKFQKASCFAVPTAGTSFIGPGLYCSPLYTVGGTFTGATITPIILRWNFTHGKKFMPWAQAAGGLLWTNHKYPAFGSSVLNLGNDGPNADASVFNFTPQGGIGMHYFVKASHPGGSASSQSVDFSANAVHISSASLGDKNPGVNASVQFTLGYTWWKK